MITAIIFDIGNVIVKVNLELWEKAFSDLGVHATKQLFLDPEMEKLIVDSYGLGKINSLQMLEYFNQKTGHNFTLEAFSKAWNSVILEVFEDALDTISDLRAKGFKVFALSDTNALHIEYIEGLYLKSLHHQSHPELNFRQLFTACYLSNETGYRKTREEAWLQILHESDNDVSPQNYLFIDDLVPNIKKAAQLGINVLHYLPTSTMKDIFRKINEINAQNDPLISKIGDSFKNGF